MFAFLKLVPLKDWLYGAAVVVILIGAWRYTAAVEARGEARIKAQDATLAAAQELHNRDVEALANAGEAQLGDTYVKTTRLPIADSPHVVCLRSTSPDNVPKAASNSGIPAAAANSPAADPLDIGPPLDRTGRDADALIVALQTQVRILVDAMNGKTAP